MTASDPLSRPVGSRPKAAQRRSRWTLCLASLLVLLGGGLLWGPWYGPTASSSSVSSVVRSESAPATNAPKYVTKKIRDFGGFEWVLAKNPLVTDEDRSQFREIDPGRWRWMRFRLVKPDGSLLEGGLGRPMAWFAAGGIEAGGSVCLDLPEMGVVGRADVLSIAPCPDPGPKPHADCRLVTGVFKHSSADCINVHLAGVAEPIGVTRNHLFWSEDRQDFIAAGTLRPGEDLLTPDGTPTHVTAIEPRPGTEPVYNLEVDVEHVYYVSQCGALVHNKYLVYWEERRGFPRYVGRTSNFERRAREQLLCGRHVVKIKGLPNRMGYKQMRALEDRLIERYGRRGIDPGGKLDNIYRGIDPRKLKKYSSQLIWAHELIEELGL